jgi:NAD(P)-dependent dehydrogenase (short-subunit alcohol dehydrogenase family)
MRIEDTCAIVTGGASGLGEATVRVLRAAGAQVTLLDRQKERGEAIAKEIGATFAETDVTSEDSVKAAVDMAVTAMGKLNAAINCAGIGTSEKTLHKAGAHSLDHYRRVVDINQVGTFNVARLAAAAMAQNAPSEDGQRGVIVNTASVAAFDGQKGQVAYASSKAAIAGMSLPMARDLAREGIRVMAIAPGIFLTPMLMGLPEEVQKQLATDVTCPQRLGDPNEYASLVKFIIECGYLNGETIRIDGALRMR